MGVIVPFPRQDAAQAAFDRYAELVRETRRNPLLVEDPAHRALRLQAYQRFTEAFDG